MDWWTFFNELPEFINKYSRRWFSFIIPLVLSITFIGILYNKVVFNIYSFKIDLSIILSLLSFIVWSIIFYLSRRKLKNNTNLPGIGIFLGDSLEYPNSISRKRFIRDMRKIFNNIFSIRVYEESDYKKYVDGLILKEKVFLDKNLFCAILLSDEEGTEDGEDVYVLNVSTGFYSKDIYDFDFNEFREKFSFDLNNVLPTSFKIHQKNNIHETLNVVRWIFVSVNYLYAIKSIVSSNPESALDYLYNVESVIDDLDQSSYAVIYIKENLLARRFEVKINSLDIILSKDFDFYNVNINNLCLELINSVLDDIKKLMERGYQGIDNVYKNVLIEKTRIQYDLGYYDESIAIIDDEELIDTHKDYAFIIKLLCMVESNNYSNQEVLRFFKSNRKKFNGKQKESMLKFVQMRYEYDEHNINLVYIFYLLNKYYKDKVLASKLEEVLLDDKYKTYYDVL